MTWRNLYTMLIIEAHRKQDILFELILAIVSVENRCHIEIHQLNELMHKEIGNKRRRQVDCYG